MRRRVLAAVAALAVVGLAVALPVFEPWKLFTNTVVNESLPETVPTSTPSAASPSPTPSATPSPKMLAGGTFISHEHETTGTVRVVQLPDGTHVLRLDDLDTSNGPDLKVWLSDAEVVEGRAGWHLFDDGAYVNLGDLKGNKGSQNYRIPADVDLADFGSVSIWCDRFNVSFGAAVLEAA
ncbi:MAG: electron transporter [Propionibacteriales bacterium]|nr:electron transporter [Propionibacteriales bacterium]